MSKNWDINCIKGRVGEQIAIAHFSKMGAGVDRTGSELTTPVSLAGYSEARHSGAQWGELMGGKRQDFPPVPDLLVSKRWTDLAGTTRYDQLFVEVKWRRCADLARIDRECTAAFREMLRVGRSIMLYVVCWEGVWDARLLVGDLPVGPFVATKLLGVAHEAKWTRSDQRVVPAFFSGSVEMPSFAEAYGAIVLPSLVALTSAGHGERFPDRRPPSDYRVRL